MPKAAYQTPTLADAAQRNHELVALLGNAARHWWPVEDRAIQEIELESIYPDPAQPRQFLPAVLRQGLAAGELTPRQVAHRLKSMEREQAPEALAILDGENGLKALAATIKAQGLLQEIGVYALDGQPHFDRLSVQRFDKLSTPRFAIVHGERRYWAHWWLVMQGDERFKRIRCVRLSHQPDAESLKLWQFVENFQRQDLSAMEKAQALASLRDMLVTKGGLSASKATEALARNLGVSERQVQHLLALCALPAEAQQVAAENKLSERSLRSVMSSKDPQARIALTRELAAQTKTSTTASLTKRKQKAAGAARFAHETNRLIKLAQSIETMTPMERKQFARALKRGPQAREALAVIAQLEREVKKLH